MGGLLWVQIGIVRGVYPRTRIGKSHWYSVSVEGVTLTFFHNKKHVVADADVSFVWYYLLANAKVLYSFLLLIKFRLKACKLLINTFIINIFESYFRLYFHHRFFFILHYFPHCFPFFPYCLLRHSASLSAATRTVEVITFQLSAAVFFLAASSSFATGGGTFCSKAYSDNPSPHPDTGIGNIRPPLWQTS